MEIQREQTQDLVILSFNAFQKLEDHWRIRGVVHLMNLAELKTESKLNQIN